MALSTALVWEIRTTGSDQNGGAFKAGAAGTDYSVQNAAQLSVADADAVGTTNLHSAIGGFTAAMVGNVLQLSGGTLTPGFYEVTAFTDTNNVTIDRSPGTGSGSTCNVGGALASLTKLASAMVASNKAFIKAGTYTEANVVTFGQAGVTPSATVAASHLIGYNATRGDLTPFLSNPTRPQIRIDTTGANGLVFSNGGWRVHYLDIAPTAGKTIQRGILFSGAIGQAIGCKIAGSTSRGIDCTNQYYLVAHCEVTGATAGYGIVLAGYGMAWGNHVHDCSGMTAGIFIGTTRGCVVARNLIDAVAGASAVGIHVQAHSCWVFGNTVHASGSHGINVNDQSFTTLVVNNLLTSNVGYGLQGPASAGTPATAMFDGNAYHNNTAGTRNSLDDTATLAVNGVTPYTNVRDVILSADPYVDAASGDFTLNNTAGGGAAVRAAAVPAAWPGLSISSFADLGAVQHEDSGGGSTFLIDGGLIR